MRETITTNEVGCFHRVIESLILTLLAFACTHYSMLMCQLMP